MSALERFINQDQSLPPLIKAGLAHLQFETIHPFLDGNGRIGRLLIVLMLVDSNLLSVPILYPSYYFKKHHQEYYMRLDRVRSDGDFEGWINYYLKAMSECAHDAWQRAKEIERLESDLRDTVANNDLFSKIHEQAANGLSLLFQYPVTSISELSEHLQQSYNATAGLIKKFEQIGILVEVSSQKRNKLFKFKMYFDVLEKEYSE